MLVRTAILVYSSDGNDTLQHAARPVSRRLCGSGEAREGAARTSFIILEVSVLAMAHDYNHDYNSKTVAVLR